MTAPEHARKLREAFPPLLAEPVEFRGEVSISLNDPEAVAEVCRCCKETLGYNYLVDISSVDNYGEDPRFTLVYELYTYAERQHLRLKTSVSEAKGELPSVTGVWKTADWHEREIFDMMGIRFRGHPDLRRILMWDGYPYFPLRKDFPLAGKASEWPDVAFTKTAPLEGGPFVTVPGGKDSLAREPRVRVPDPDSVPTNARLERRHDVAARDLNPGSP